MSVVRPIIVLFVVTLCSVFISPLSPLLCFITMTEITRICVSLCCFTDEVKDTYANCMYVCNLVLNQN